MRGQLSRRLFGGVPDSLLDTPQARLASVPPLDGHLRLSSYYLLTPEPLLWVAPQRGWSGLCTKAALRRGRGSSSRCHVS